MSCVTLKQWNEAVVADKKALKALESEGFDISESWSELESRDKAFKENRFSDIKKSVVTADKSIKWMDDSYIAKANQNKPATVTGTRINIKNAYSDADGNVVYVGTYKDGKKEYFFSSESLIFDQMDGKNSVYGSELNVDARITNEYEKLAYDIFNNQENAIKLFDSLVGKDVTEHTKELKELLTTITDPLKNILNPFKVYLNRKASENKGMAVAYGLGKESYIKLDIVDGSNTVNQNMSAAEVYLHEMIHMSVETAMAFKKGPLTNVISDMTKLYEQASEIITVDMLVENGDRKRAQRLWDYMFNNEQGHGLSEFIAYGMVNEKIKNILKDVKVNHKVEETEGFGLWKTMTNLLVKLYNGIRSMINLESDKMMADQLLNSLVIKMWEHNNTTVKKAKGLAGIRKAGDKARDYADKTILTLVDTAATTLDVSLDMVFDLVGAEKAKKVKNTLKLFHPWASDEQIKVRGEAAATMDKYASDIFGDLFAKEGAILTLADYFSKHDTLRTRVEKLGLIAQKIDGKRNHLINAVGGDILNKLGNPSDKAQVAISDIVLDMDLKVLVDEFGVDGIKDLITDKALLNKAIETKRKALTRLAGSKEVSNYWISQTKGLGKYLHNGIGGSSVNRHASGIFFLVNSGFELSDFKDKDGNSLQDIDAKPAIKLIDELASLEAISNIEQSRVGYIKEVFEKHKDGIETTIMYHKMWLNDYKAQAMEYGTNNYPEKGETKDLSASYLDSKIDKMDEETVDLLATDGYRLVSETAVKGIGLYVKRAPGLDEFEKQAVAKINLGKKLHDIVGMRATDTEVDSIGMKQKLDSITKKAHDDALLQFNNITEPNMDGLSMITSKFDNVVNYTVTMDKNMYADALNQERKTPLLLGKMIAEIHEKKDAELLNKATMSVIYKDMLENYERGSESKNRREYIEIGPDAVNEGASAKRFADQIWDGLPQNIRLEILKNRKKGKKYIAVRRDLAVAYFGSRVPSIFNGRLPFATRTIGEIMDDNGLGKVKEFLQELAVYWQEIVSIEKVNIVVKMPGVILDNIISNFNYAVALGQFPWEVADGQIKMFKATDEYLKADKELNERIVRYRAGTDRSPENKAKISRLKEALANNPVKPLMDAGLFTAITEDATTESLRNNSIFEDMTKKYTDKVPKIIRDGASAIYMTETTGLYSSMLMMVQYSDFVARANRYYYLLDNNVAPSAAIKMVMDELVNYNTILPDFFRWVDKLGFGMFFKYFFGANLSLARKLENSPSSMIAMGLLLDLPNPVDAMIGNKDLTSNIHSPIGIIENLVDIGLHPPAAKALGLI